MIPNCEIFYVSPCERAFPRHSLYYSRTFR